MQESETFRKKYTTRYVIRFRNKFMNNLEIIGMPVLLNKKDKRTCLENTEQVETTTKMTREELNIFVNA